MRSVQLTKNEFSVVQKLLFKECGVSLSDKKQTMAETRLFQRIEHYKVDSYADYLKIVQISKSEKNEFLNALTTNETYFFREEKHFDFLSNIAQQSETLNIWSAAASMGAEAYSIAMILDSKLPKDAWSITASDINTEVLEVALSISPWATFCSLAFSKA